METTNEANSGIINDFSFTKFLSLNKIANQGCSYKDLCYIMKTTTDADEYIFKYPVRINAYILVLCSKGNIDLTCDLRHYTLSANRLFLYRPGMIVQVNAIEPSELTIGILRQEFLDNLQIQFRNIAQNFMQLYNTCTLRLLPEESIGLTHLYELTDEAIRSDESNPFYHEVIFSTARAVLYKVMYIIIRNSEEYATQKSALRQEELHFEKFMRLLSLHYREEHSIRFYASRMNLTPKYLSMLVKNTSGKLATRWINDYVILEAKSLIKYSGKSIQEIAYELHFPNQSFFGKYFKKHTGLSPKAYREQE